MASLETGGADGNSTQRDRKVVLVTGGNSGIGLECARTLVPGVSTRRKSGEALARLVLDPTLTNVSGKYFPSHTRWKEAPSSDLSYDAQLARVLWEKSIAMSRLEPGASPLLRAA